MSHRFSISRATLVSLGAALCVTATLAAQTQPGSKARGVNGAGAQAGSAKTAKNWTPPHTAWGDPDLQGIWNNGTITPLERPKEYEGREHLTPEEIAKLEHDAQTRDDNPPREGDVGFYNAIWWDRGKSTGRTALIIDPPDGKIPPMTPEGQKRAEERRLRFGQTPAAKTAFNGPEDLTLTERCIMYGPLPRVPTGYNNNYQIQQAPGYVAILQEEIHETRIIPVDGRPHLPSNMRQWLGDARGHWEGNTLVVETTNFTQRGNFRGSAETLRLVERFTRVDPNTIDYQFTIDDPTTWTKPWTASIPMAKTAGPMLEYACHEGNYAMEDILSASRVQEKAVNGSGANKSR